MSDSRLKIESRRDPGPEISRGDLHKWPGNCKPPEQVTGRYTRARLHLLNIYLSNQFKLPYRGITPFYEEFLNTRR